MTEAPLPQGASDRPAGASEMVERVARAIALDECQSWDELDFIHAAMYVSFARAAISAMREPTVEMIGVAGAEVLNRYVGADPGDSYHGTATWAAECWEAMIDAAAGSPAASPTEEASAK